MKKKREFYLLVQDLHLFDEEFFFKYFRITATQYEESFLMVASVIKKSSTKRECIGPDQHLSVTLRYLAIGRIIYETCEALWRVLSSVYVKCPQNETKSKEVAHEFHVNWNFPHCIGAIDEARSHAIPTVIWFDVFLL